MTNKMIILLEQQKLFDQGLIKKTGRTITVMNLFTQELEEVDELEPIHTYQTWKSLGFQVKKGQKAVAKFPIWKFTNGKMEEEDVRADVDVEHNENRGYCFMKLSAFFSASQVERIGD